MGRHESREAKSLPRKSRRGRRKRRGVMGARPDSGAEAGAGDRAGRTCEQLESQVQGAENSLSRSFIMSVIELPFCDH